MARSLAVRLLAVILACLVQPAVAFVVEDIELHGLQRLEAATVLTYLPLEVGEEFGEERSADILRKLFETQLFSDVQLSRRGNVLVIEVVERPAITEINFEGLKVISSDSLEAVLADAGIAAGRIYNQQLFDQLHTEILQQYHANGHYAARVDIQIEELVGNRVRVNIVVDEGEAAYIRQIRIIGSVSYPESDLIALFGSETRKWYILLGDSGRYSKPALQGDLERLRTFYLNAGHLNFRIDDVQISLSPDQKAVYITVHLTEGKRYAVREVFLSGVFVVPRERMLPHITTRAGEYFSNQRMQESTNSLTQQLGDEGYAFARVNPILERDDEAAEVSINYFLDPGQRVYVRRINIVGNAVTLDEALRRELRQLEGGWLSPPRMERSRRRLQRLPYIDAADITQQRVPGSANQVDLTVRVTERSSGNFTVGAGFSSGSGLTLSTGIEQENFLGTGNRVGLAFDNRETSTRYSFDFLNPYYTINGISRGFGFVYRRVDTTGSSTADNNQTEYQSNDFSVYLNYGIPISEDSFFQVSANLDTLNLESTAFTSREVLEFLSRNGGDCTTVMLAMPAEDDEAEGSEEMGTGMEMMEMGTEMGMGMEMDMEEVLDSCDAEYLNVPVTASFRYDTRNRSLFASEGSLREISVTTTIPGSDLEFYVIRYRQEEYLPLGKDLSISVRGEVDYGGGYGGTDGLPFFEKFVTGGPHSVRGFQQNSLSPRDSNGDPFGGDFKVGYSAEMLFAVPYIAEANLRGLVFLDGGYAFEDVDEFDLSEMRVSTGIGISWLSPLGGVSVTFSVPLNEKEGDETENFQFNLGTL